MSFSGLSSLSSNVKSTKKAIISSPFITNGSMNVTWFGSSHFDLKTKGTMYSPITTAPTAPTPRIIVTSYIPQIIGTYTFSGTLRKESNSNLVETNYIGILGGPDLPRYILPASAFCTVTYTMPIQVQIKKLYHATRAISGDYVLAISCVVRGSNDGGINWTEIASLIFTDNNYDRLTDPTTISSTDKFNMLKFELQNNKPNVSKVFQLDFIGDFYA